MKPNKDENYKSWVDRVEIFEKHRALKHIAKGVDVDIVLDEMSNRIMAKLLYPLLNAINNLPVDVDIKKFEKDRIAYYEKMKYIGKAADHVDPNT